MDMSLNNVTFTSNFLFINVYLISMYIFLFSVDFHIVLETSPPHFFHFIGKFAKICFLFNCNENKVLNCYSFPPNANSEFQSASVLTLNMV